MLAKHLITFATHTWEGQANTKLQDSFNIISFDTHDKIVKVVKVGCDVTRQLTQKRRLVYRYAQFTDIYDTVYNKGLVLSD